MTLRNAPLWDRTVSDILLIWGKREVEYFCKGGWTGFGDLLVRQNQRAECSSRAAAVFRV
jgi:hypothetical protein